MSLTGADFVAEALAALGVRFAFTIVSIHNMPLCDAINRVGRTRLIDVRHEQAGTHAADGYARATGEMGVMIASTGPGTTNTVTGLYEAQAASSKVLVITGQAETAFYGKGLGYVHEAENQLAMLRTVTRRAESPRRIEQLADAFYSVVADMHVGRGAPGALEIPIDLQYAEIAPGLVRSLEPVEVHPDPQMLDDVLQRIRGARRRVIVAGGGVVAADAAVGLTVLAERLECPVLTSANGRGAIPEDHELCVGNFYNAGGVYEALSDADLTLAIGTRFAVGVEGRGAALTPPGELVQIDVDPTVIGRTHRAACAVVADAHRAIDRLLAGLDDIGGNDRQFNAGVFEAAGAVRQTMRHNVGEHLSHMMDTMRRHLSREGLWVRDSTIPAYFFGNQLFPVYGPRTSIGPATGAIGPAFPLGIGAALGTSKPCIVIHGDGGFMLHASELATAAQYAVPVVVVVFNDRGYGILRWLQQTRFGRVNETELGRVDFVAMAVSMGVPGQLVADLPGFDDAIARGLSSGGPFLVEVDMTRFEGVRSLVAPRED